jgi:uncharacterized membrane protein
MLVNVFLLMMGKEDARQHMKIIAMNYSLISFARKLIIVITGIMLVLTGSTFSLVTLYKLLQKM